MFLNALPYVPCEIEARTLGVFQFKNLDNSEALGVVIKAAVVRHQSVELVFASVSAGRMAEVVGKGDRLGEIFIQAEGARNRPADRRHFNRVGESGSIVVARAI